MSSNRLPTFYGPELFAQKGSAYQLLPFRFIDLDRHKVLVNQAGEHHVVSPETLHQLVDHTLAVGTKDYDDLKAKHFLADTSSLTPLTLLSTKVRTKYSFLSGFTKLHIFVVTLRCDHSCQYCQVSRVGASRSKYDMTRESADRSLDLVFRGPAPVIKIEFQGGEPLLNFELIQYIVLEALKRNDALGFDKKNIQFVVTTNLSFITDEILEFLKEHNVAVSTSLDGPASVHNANRPRPGNDAYENTIEGIRKTRTALGHDAVSALMTTTQLSLGHPEAIIDEYVTHGFDHVFVRPISPYGFAVKTRRKTGYERSAFLGFYHRALAHIIELNRSGVRLTEIYAQICLTKILTPYATGYVDLQSPAGGGIGAVVYNYDGDVYFSDEARMLAEMGDKAFRLGNVNQDSYESIFGGGLLRSLVDGSCSDGIPGCADCAFQPYCGTDPVENYATQGDTIGHRPTSDFCTRNMGILKHLLRLYHSGDPFITDLFWSWVNRAPLEALIPTMPQ